MNTTDWIGSIGVTLLLLAYFLQLRNMIKKEGNLYLALNFIGAILAFIASALLQYIPFMVLEAIWAFVSFFPLATKFKTHKKAV